MKKLISSILKQPKRLLLISIPSLVVIGLIIFGVVYYQANIAPFKRTVLSVDNSKINMDYFLKRLKWAGSEATTSAVIEQLIYEQVVKLMAPEFGISVSDTQVEEQLRYDAAYAKANPEGSSTLVAPDAITDVEFEQWYADQLATTELSDTEYKALIRTDLMAAQLQKILADKVPTEADQIHLYVNVLANIDDVNKVLERIAAGETFKAVTKETSIDQSAESEGEIGWMPRGVTLFDDVVFKLEVGEVSAPVEMNSGQYALFFVSEKAVNRHIDDIPLQALKDGALYTWLSQEVPKHKISNNLDEKTLEWVNSQLKISS